MSNDVCKNNDNLYIQSIVIVITFMVRFGKKLHEVVLSQGFIWDLSGEKSRACEQMYFCLIEYRTDCLSDPP